MSPTRFDMYAFIHKALRAMMADALVALGRLDVNEEEDLAQTLARLRALLAACSSHLQHEEDFIHPAIEARRPGAARVTADDHRHHRDQIAALESAIHALEQASLGQRAALAHALYLELAAFIADNLQHMQVEERDNNAALQATYTDEELLAIHDRLVGSIPPQEMAAALRWMLPNLSAPERAKLLGGMALSLPRAAFDGVLVLARQNLNPRDWLKLMMALGPMPVAA
ncbi:MAG: hemerythrin domain-containing protein [Burkholderiaceae bacterium]|nr:hemerythrin domain-containing protein [Burkholderiaceae bacterium]